jgi:hypothetical protein
MWQRLCRLLYTWQSAKNTWQRIRRQRNLCHLPRGKQSAKPLPHASMAVSKENERRWKMTERIPFADCHAAVGKSFFLFFL